MVNVSNQEFCSGPCGDVDLTIADRGIAYQRERYYRSRIEFSGTLGHGWDYSYNMRLVADQSNIIFYDGKGRGDCYLLIQQGQYASL